MHHFIVLDLDDAPRINSIDAPGAQILSISCSFWEKLAK